MRLHLTSNQWPEQPFIRQPIYTNDLLNTSMKYFDKDGYEINKLEQLYYIENKIDISEKHLYHTANHVSWIVDLDQSESGLVVDHSLINCRWAYRGHAKAQLEDNQLNRPIVNKLLSIRPKYGIDFSLDWVSSYGCTEIFHIEADYFDRDEALEAKAKAENIILNTDWIDGANSVISKMDQWVSLCSDDQSDWKARHFGWHRAFDNKKVFTL